MPPAHSCSLHSMITALIVLTILDILLMIALGEMGATVASK